MNTHDFQKAAKEFRAGRFDLAKFTDMVFAKSPQATDARADLSSTGGSASSPGGGLAGYQTAKGTSGGGPIVAITPAVGAGRSPHGPNSPENRLDIDEDRARRCGWPEVIYGPGKTVEDLLQAARQLLSRGQDVLITRLPGAMADPIVRQFPQAIYSHQGQTLRIIASDRSATPGDDGPGDSRSPVAVVTAGTGDIGVAEEAVETLRWMKLRPHLIYDVGVAGPHRLLPHVPTLQSCAAIVVVAGMEGALPSVVGGHVACPVIAVPTSVGYGASFQGLAPLLGMLNSCAANVTTVNIDGGFKGGFLAGLITHAARSAVQH